MTHCNGGIEYEFWTRMLLLMLGFTMMTDGLMDRLARGIFYMNHCESVH